MLKELMQYRELLKANVRKDIRGRYKASFLGVLWSFLNPLLQVTVYAIVFPYLFRNTGDNYLLYLVTGIIPWNYFMTSVTAGMGSIKGNAGIIKKVYFPRAILPISSVFSGLVNFLISIIIILIFCIGTGVIPNYLIVYLPIVLLVQTVLILGMALLLSAVNVYIQDTEHIIVFILSLLMYATPIIYSVEIFADVPRMYNIIQLNPITQITQAYRDIFMNQITPDFVHLGYVLLFGLLVLGVGILVFNKLEKGFAEEL